LFEIQIFFHYTKKMSLQDAIRRNNVEEVRRLVSAENVNTPFRHIYSDTPLTYALRNRTSLELIAVLLNAGADVNYSDNNIMAPLEMAIREGSPAPVLIALVNAGANRLSEMMFIAFYERNLNALAILYARGGRISEETINRQRHLAMFDMVMPFLGPLLAMDLADPVALEAFLAEQIAARRITAEVGEELRTAGQRLREDRAARRRGHALQAYASASRRGGRRSTRRRSTRRRSTRRRSTRRNRRTAH
jgi:hypothetical protein